MKNKYMKHLQKYESYKRGGYKYLDKENEIKLKDFVDKTLTKEEVKKYINKLKLEDIDNVDYQIDEIIDDILGKMNFYQNMYQNIKGPEIHTPEIHNSFTKLLKKMKWIDTMIFNKMIEILEKHTEVLDDYKEYSQDNKTKEKVLKHFDFYFDSKDIGIL